MSKQPRQTVRKKIRINEEKSILGTSCPTASTVGERPACSALSLLGEKVFEQRPEWRLQSLLSEFLGQIHSLFCQNGYSRGVAVCCAVLKISFTSPLPPDSYSHPGHCRELSNNQKAWDPELCGYSLLTHRQQRHLAWGRLSADRIDSNRSWLQKWDQWAHHRLVFHEYLLQAGPCARLHICKNCPWKPQDGYTGGRRERRKVKKLGQVPSENSTHWGQTGFVFSFHGKARNLLEKMLMHC